jgi:hypothetical protein
MQIKGKVIGAIQWAVLSAAISVLVFLLERRLNKSFKKRQRRLDT